jgi:3-methyladenine DNA glycosylase/8-oxoguanine DNA glycosylase
MAAAPAPPVPAPEMMGREAPNATRSLRLDAPIDLRRTLRPMQRGHRDPCWGHDGGDIWRAGNTPEGPVTLRLRALATSGTIHAAAWGAGAPWALDALPDLVGANDDVAPFEAMVRRVASGAQAARSHDTIRQLHRRFAGFRIPRSRTVVEALVPIILEQKVTGVEARQSYRDLVHGLGAPAPGPAGGRDLRVPPPVSTLAITPSWTWHRFGVEAKRADTVRRACLRADRLDEAADLSPADAYRRLTAIAGIGPWTAAEVSLVALGDTDAVVVGDYHLPNQVAWVLAGIPRADDSVMLDLLEPYRGQRGRVMRLIMASGVGAPRRGPRLEPVSFRHR